MFPRAPRRHRIVECYPDCKAQYTERAEDCDCLERDDAAYEAECERRLEAYRNGD